MTQPKMRPARMIKIVTWITYTAIFFLLITELMMRMDCTLNAGFSQQVWYGVTWRTLPSIGGRGSGRFSRFN